MYICAQLECLIFQLWQLEKCIWSSGIVVTDGCETLCSFWELKEPLEGQLILLTSKSLLQNQKWSLKSCQCEIQALCPLLPLPLGTVFLFHFSLTSASITYIGTKTWSISRSQHLLSSGCTILLSWELSAVLTIKTDSNNCVDISVNYPKQSDQSLCKSDFHFHSYKTKKSFQEH